MTPKPAWWVAGACLAVSCAALVFASETAPDALVERVVERGGVSYRLTVFDNGMVVARRRSETMTLLRRRRLSPPELDVYVRLFRLVTEELAREERERPEDGAGTIVLELPGLKTMTIRYDPDRPPSLALGRLLQALDDLERVTFGTPPEAEAIRRWEPRRGDIVELYGGARARVTRVRDDGFVVLKHLEDPLVEAVRREDLVARVRRVVEAAQ